MSANMSLRSSGFIGMRAGRSLARNCGLAGAAAAVIAASLWAAPGVSGILGAALGVLMLAVAAIDARELIIPNALTAAALALGLLDAALRGGWDGVGIACLRGAALALCFLTLRAGYRWLRRREGIGLGDVKLAGVAGAWLDWTMLPIAVEIAALAALAIFTLHWLRGGSLRRTTRVPFGLFFAPAIWLCWLLATAITPGLLAAIWAP
jgi:leader peptidase (prepilin peptidase) / N-methyltransferase